jgi:hypothetical protein
VACPRSLASDLDRNSALERFLVRGRRSDEGTYCMAMRVVCIVDPIPIPACEREGQDEEDKGRRKWTYEDLVPDNVGRRRELVDRVEESRSNAKEDRSTEEEVPVSTGLFQSSSVTSREKDAMELTFPVM